MSALAYAVMAVSPVLYTAVCFDAWLSSDCVYLSADTWKGIMSLGIGEA